MAYRLHDGGPAPAPVRHLTLVPFLPDGACAAVPDRGGGLALPAGEVRAGEHWLVDASLRVPLETAGFRPQRVHLFATDRPAGAEPAALPQVPLAPDISPRLSASRP